MAQITTTGRVTETFDDANLSTGYRASFTPDGGVVIEIDVFEGPTLVGTITSATFTAEQVDGFSEN